MKPDLDERAVVRHYTLGRDDLDLIAGKRGDHNRLGFAVLLCRIRQTGQVAAGGDTMPDAVIAFVAKQLGIDPASHGRYARRDETRREHAGEIVRRLGLSSLDRAVARALVVWLVGMAANERSPARLAEMLVREVRSRRILLPPPPVLDMMLRRARLSADKIMIRSLAGGLDSARLDALDRLLEPMPEKSTARLAWLKTASASPSARNMAGMIERLAVVREIGIDRDAGKLVPADTLSRLADEGLRMTAQHLRDLAAPRRHATLAAAALQLETSLTDGVLGMFDKLMGTLSRRAERQTADRALSSVRDANGRLLTLARACRVLISACEQGADPKAAIDRETGWTTFVQSVAAAEELARPEAIDPKAELISRYATMRSFAGGQE